MGGNMLMHTCTTMGLLLLLLLLDSAPPATAHAAEIETETAPVPLACQPNDEQPMLPTFHIIGNVTKHADKSITLEPINDCSGVTFYEGIWHVWHQCCQSHWDHVISKDLVHWQRLPPPIQPLTTRTWDGSITLLPKEDGGPVILYDAEDGKLGVHDAAGVPVGSGDRPILGVARLANPADKYLQTWTRVDNNPVKFEGAAGAFPGQVWKNGQHWNFVMQGNRYQSNDSTFHSFSNMGPMVGKGEHGGQWWIPMPNTTDGSPPPPSAPNHIVNVNGGATYLWGDYDPANESFTPFVPSGASAPKTSVLERAQGGWWGAQNANDRMLMIGWALGDFNGPAGPGINFLTRLTLLREVTYDPATNDLVSNPVPELSTLRSGTVASERKVSLQANAVHHVANTAGGAAASADIELNFTVPQGGGSFGACVLAKPPGSKPFVPHWEVVPNSNAAYDKVGVPGNKATFIGNASDADAALALCKNTPNCKEFAWNIFGPNPPPAFQNSTNATYMINNPTDLSTPSIRAQPGAVSGKFLSADSSGEGLGITLTLHADKTMTVVAGACNPPNGSSSGGGGATGTPNSGISLLDGEDVVSVRILPDRSVVDFFVQGGRWAGTTSWISGYPRTPEASQVSVWSSSATTADIDVHSMGCGWEYPSYTDSPTI